MAKNPKIHYTTAVYDHGVDGNVTVGTDLALADSGIVPAGSVVVSVVIETVTAITGASGGIDLLLDPTDGTANVEIVSEFAVAAAGLVKDTAAGGAVAKESKFAIDATGSNVTAGKFNFLIGYTMGL